MNKIYLIKSEVFSFPVYDSNYEIIFLNRGFDQKNIFCFRLDEIEYDFIDFKYKVKYSESYNPGAGRDGIKYFKILIDASRYLIDKKYLCEI